MTFFKLRVVVAWVLALVAAVGSLTAITYRALACPFCSAVSLTFSEEINNSQVAVIAKLTEPPPPPSDTNSLDVAKAKFEIIKVLKGEEALGKERTIDAVYFGDSPVGTTFLIMGIDPPNINWSTPIAITDRGIDYVVNSMDLPKDGPERLVFFQDYLEDKDETLARDAYDEFAKAPYSEVLGLAPRMHHEKLLEWIQSTEIPVSRRRLYLTMLGAAGDQKDIPVLEEMIKSKDRQTKGALDALVASYLTLKGPEGMPLVEDLFLKNKDAEYTDTYATIMALRFHGTEEKIISKDRLLVGLRMMLDRPQLADLVIPDLARWEDWSVMDRLVELFKTSDEESSWVRVPVINYLRACPQPEAKQKIDELAKIDPESIKRANSFFPLGAAAAGTTAGANKSEEKPTDSEDSKINASPAPAGAANSGQAPTEKKTSSAPNTQSSATPQPRVRGIEVSEAKPSAILGHLAPAAAAVPGPPVRSLPVMVGMIVSALVLAVAFWGILKGGQRSVG